MSNIPINIFCPHFTNYLITQLSYLTAIFQPKNILKSEITPKHKLKTRILYAHQNMFHTFPYLSN